MGGYAQAYTLYSSVRPFGVTAIIGGMDEEGGPGLWMVEPSGVGWVCAALSMLDAGGLGELHRSNKAKYSVLNTGLLWCCYRSWSSGCQSGT